MKDVLLNEIEDKESYICFKCPGNKTCPYAWDEYNKINEYGNECLMDK